MRELIFIGKFSTEFRMKNWVFSTKKVEEAYLTCSSHARGVWLGHIGIKTMLRIAVIFGA
jgi:hypothetical protein